MLSRMSVAVAVVLALGGCEDTDVSAADAGPRVPVADARPPPDVAPLIPLTCPAATLPGCDWQRPLPRMLDDTQIGADAEFAAAGAFAIAAQQIVAGALAEISVFEFDLDEVHQRASPVPAQLAAHGVTGVALYGSRVAAMVCVDAGVDCRLLAAAGGAADPLVEASSVPILAVGMAVVGGRLCAFGDGIACVDGVGDPWDIVVAPGGGDAFTALSGDESLVVAVGARGRAVVRDGGAGTPWRELALGTDDDLVAVVARYDRFSVATAAGALIDGEPDHVTTCPAIDAAHVANASTATGRALAVVTRSGELRLLAPYGRGDQAWCRAGSIERPAAGVVAPQCGYADNVMLLTRDAVYGQYYGCPIK